jgi:hypothetical protein
MMLSLVLMMERRQRARSHHAFVMRQRWRMLTVWDRALKGWVRWLLVRYWPDQVGVWIRGREVAQIALLTVMAQVAPMIAMGLVALSMEILVTGSCIREGGRTPVRVYRIDQWS